MLITIIDENEILSNILCKKISIQGYNVKIIEKSEDLLNGKYVNSDLFVIGNIENQNICKNIINFVRKYNNTNPPIIVIGNYSSQNIIELLNLGADGFVNFPFSFELLVAKIRAFIRRSYKVTISSKLIYKNLSYCSSEKILTIKGMSIDLSPRELQLVEYFFLNPGKIISKEKLIVSVWGEYDILKITDNNINATISKLRKKLGKAFNLKTLVNRGYILEK